MNQPQELLIDVRNVKTREELHELLATLLKFPDYYGRNWDAFDECIRDFPPVTPVRVVGMQELGSVLPREATLMRQCFSAFEAEMPGRRKVYVS